MKLIAFDPPLSPDELSLFKDYHRRLKTSHIRALKHHAESMLELYRPSLFTVYQGVKSCKSIRQVASEMHSTPKTIKQRQTLAYEWLRLALVQVVDEPKKKAVKVTTEPMQLSLYEKVY
jgi:hypothetical protein